MTTFELSDIETYGCEDYSRLGAALGVSEALPAPGEIEFLQSRHDSGPFPPRHADPA